MVDNKEKIDQAWANLPQELADRFSIVRSEDFYLEFMHKSVSKGNALKRLCAELDLTASEVLALGNAQNDNSMIEFAGTGVAMGNSVSKTLAIADDVTADNNHDGVAAAIEKYVF